MTIQQIFTSAMTNNNGKRKHTFRKLSGLVSAGNATADKNCQSRDDR